MDYFPIFVDLKGQACLVVGGGEIAARKIRLLRRSGAQITVVAPRLCGELQGLVKQASITHIERAYGTHLLNNQRMVVAATDDRVVNQRVSEDAQRRGILVNVVDDPGLCSFITPSIVDRSPVTIAISSSGKSPVLARLLRARIESAIPQGYSRLAQLAAEYRDRVKVALPDTDVRRRLWENVLSGPVAELVFAGRDKQARDALDKAVDDARTGTALKTGEVYLVGAGPGDPELLTLRALRLMQQADVVLHDALIAPELMELVRRDAERVYVGKRRNRHTLPQEDINQLMVDLASAGKRVLRLKGGDPFIFGRGGEEIAHLTEAGIDFQVVPGITAAQGCGAYAGIPLTHRDLAQSVRFITGHLKDNTLDIDWSELTRKDETLVFYMGLTAIERICKGLIDAGLPSDWPAAVIQEGTTARQQVVLGGLAALPEKTRQSAIKGPALIIVGRVTQLHNRLSWYQGAETALSQLFNSADKPED